MQYFITETGAGGLRFQAGGVAPEGAISVTSDAYHARLAAHAPKATAISPEEISSAQAKIQLRRAGLREKVDAAVAKADGEVQDWYAEARSWHRQNKYVAEIGKALSLSDATIDKLFEDAAKIGV